ncbi:MAG: CRISPR-associated endonuclease Cas2 [Blastocatellia bacterium]
MLILIAYDVSTIDKAGVRRLRRVAQACQDFGQRVQNSVFECNVGKLQWATLRTRLLEEIDPNRDSLRFYFLETDTRIEHHGCKIPIDFEKPIII